MTVTHITDLLSRLLVGAVDPSAVKSVHYDVRGCVAVIDYRDEIYRIEIKHMPKELK